MKTVTNLFVASLCLGLSGVVYAQPAGMAKAMPVASATDSAKPKAAKHKLSAPTETSATPVTTEAKTKSAEHREHAVNAAPSASATKVKPAAPALKDAKPAPSPVSKAAPAVEAPKAAK